MLGFPDKFKVGVFIQDFPRLLKERKEAEQGREKSKYEVNTCLMTTSVPQTPHRVTAAGVLSRWGAMALGRASPLENWDKACLECESAQCGARSIPEDSGDELKWTRTPARLPPVSPASLAHLPSFFSL